MNSPWLGDQRDRPIPPKCYCGGGATFFAYAPFFRSPQVQSFWKFIQCLGGIWTNRWAEQNLFPVVMSVLADNPEKRYHMFTNFAATHRGSLLQPHASWGTPSWPYHPSDKEDKTIIQNTTMVHFKRGCIVYYVNNEDMEFIRRSLINLEFHFLWQFSYPVFIFTNDITEDQKNLITSTVDSRITKITIVNTDADRKSFNTYKMFEQKELQEYGYFLRMDPRTNFVATLHWDPFRFMEDNKFLLAFHRLKAPEHVALALDPVPNDDLWNKVTDIANEMGLPYSERDLTPTNFKYSLQHFMMGSMDFFKSKQYLDLAKEVPEAHSSHLFPLAISLLEDSTWRKIGDLSSLMMNWGVVDAIPFYQRSWWGPQEHTPIWPFKFTNKSPPCDA